MPVKTLSLTDKRPTDSPGQPSLFSETIIEALTTEEGRGVYTAERLKEQDPNKYALIAFWLAQEMPEREIAFRAHVHHRTVAAVRDAEPEAIDVIRGRLIKKLRRGGTLLLERLIEHPDLVPWNVLGMTMQQCFSQAEVMDGRVTQRVEQAVRVDIFSDWESFVEKQLPAESVVEIGLVGGKKPAIEIGSDDQPPKRDRSAGLPLSDASVPTSVARTDAESDDRNDASLEPARDDTSCDPSRGSAAALESRRSEAGGEGVSADTGGAKASTDEVEGKIFSNRPS